MNVALVKSLIPDLSRANSYASGPMRHLISNGPATIRECFVEEGRQEPLRPGRLVGFI